MKHEHDPSECRVHVLIRHQEIIFGHRKKVHLPSLLQVQESHEYYMLMRTHLWTIIGRKKCRDKTDIHLMFF